MTIARTNPLWPTLRWINNENNEPSLVSSLSRRCFTAEESLSEQAVLDFMGSSDHIPKVLVLGREIVGYNFYVLHKKIVMIQQFGVSAAYRKQGFATKMMRELQMNLPGLRRRIIAVEVCENNVEAQLFLRQLGFTWFKTLKGDNHNPDCYAFKYVSRK